MAPSVTLVIDGQPVSGLLRATVHSTNCYDADSFSFTLALGPPPLTAVPYWASVSAATVEIVVTTGSLSDVLMIGVVDVAHIDPLRGTVTVEGRDLSARLIDSYWRQDFVNQTASEVVTAIALQYGLVPVVTPTAGSVGRYYGDGYTKLSLGQFSKFRSNWDVVVQLARDNGFDAFVDGWNLHFQPASTQSAIPIPLSLADVSKLNIECIKTVPNNPVLCVQSWNSQDMVAYANTGQSSVATPGTSNPFLFTSANMTAEQVEASTVRLAAELRRLRIVVGIEVPWTPNISPRSVIILTGTNSDFDTTYLVDSIESHFCTTTGSIQRIRAISLEGDI